MLVCGLKLTHDGAVALFDGTRLVFSVEMEKLADNPRHAAVHDLQVVAGLLADFGYSVADVDQFVIDGWEGVEHGSVRVSDRGRTVQDIELAPYHEGERSTILRPHISGTFQIDGVRRDYVSFYHASGHVMSAYCTSPFARRGEPAFALAWDGAMFPRLYRVDPAKAVVENGGSLFPLIGHAYATACQYFGPWRGKFLFDLSLAGKLMAYIALGTPDDVARGVFEQEYKRYFVGDGEQARMYRDQVGGWGLAVEPAIGQVYTFFATVAARLRDAGVTDEDALATMHDFLQEQLVAGLVERITAWQGPGPWNLCFAGGCALNIKWNSALRAHPLFSGVWVPPFPNDSGSAIGTAAAFLCAEGSIEAVDWHVRSGPEVGPAPAPPGWASTECSAEQLAAVLHETAQPVVVLNGRAETGPRALGGRSILAAPTDPAMKALLNKIKNREYYRPVAPICLTDQAPAIFDPGTPDPYMLFEHHVREEWVDRIPAVIHLDGTARLQTVDRADDPFVEQVLREYHRITGVPVLCNTSANHHGRGFFPDVASAAEWGGADMIWCAGLLHRRVRG